MADINIETYQADMLRLNREKLVLEQTLACLVERDGELERLVKDYRALLACWHALRPHPVDMQQNAYDAMLQKVEARYKELIGE